MERKNERVENPYVYPPQGPRVRVSGAYIEAILDGRLEIGPRMIQFTHGLNAKIGRSNY